jgi:hypothetical protein
MNTYLEHPEIGVDTPFTDNADEGFLLNPSEQKEFTEEEKSCQAECSNAIG